MAMEGKRIIKKSGIYLVGNLTSKVMASLLIPIYAIYVTAAELGSYDMVVTICSAIIPFAFCCLWEATLRFVLKEESEDKTKEYISSIVFYMFLLMILLVIGGMAVKMAFSIKYEYYFFAIFYILFFGSSQMMQAITRATKHNQVYVISGVSSTAVNLLGVVLFVCWKRFSVYGLLTSAILGQAAIIVIDILGIKLWNYVTINRINFVLLKRMLVFSIPLILNQVLSWLVSGFSKIVINVHIGVEANGLYSFANKFSTLVTTLGSVVAMALFEEAILASNSDQFGKKYGEAVSTLNKLFYSLITLAMPAIVIFYNLFAGNEYMNSLYLVPILLVYSIMTNFSTNLGSVFQVIDKTKYQFITTLIGTLCSCGLSYILVYKFSITGVVVGQLIGSLVLVASRHLFINRHVKVYINYRTIFIYLLLFTVVSIVSINLGLIANMVVFIVVLGIEAFVNRSYCKKVLSGIRNKLGLSR